MCLSLVDWMLRCWLKEEVGKARLFPQVHNSSLKCKHHIHVFILSHRTPPVNHPPSSIKPYMHLKLPTISKLPLITKNVLIHNNPKTKPPLLPPPSPLRTYPPATSASSGTTPSSPKPPPPTGSSKPTTPQPTTSRPQPSRSPSKKHPAVPTASGKARQPITLSPNQGVIAGRVMGRS